MTIYPTRGVKMPPLFLEEACSFAFLCCIRKIKINILMLESEGPKEEQTTDKQNMSRTSERERRGPKASYKKTRRTFRVMDAAPFPPVLDDTFSVCQRFGKKTHIASRGHRHVAFLRVRAVHLEHGPARGLFPATRKPGVDANGSQHDAQTTRPHELPEDSDHLPVVGS